jgi:phospholipase/carboxylesterase
MFTNTTPITINDWVMRIRQPEGSGPFPVILMLHGWTGDENSMWVFAPRLPKNALLIAPRGLFSSPSGGYSWHSDIKTRWPSINDFLPAAEKLFEVISSKNFPIGNFSSFHLLGFSQGAALAYSMAILYPERINSLAGLSGFLPDRTTTRLSASALNGLPVFIAHGTGDDLVSVDRARAAVAQIEQAGAQVTYCEDDVGHKLSAKCFHGLEAFYQSVGC